MTDARAVQQDAPRARRAGKDENRDAKPLLVALFIVLLVLPVNFYLGPIRMTPYRLVLIVAFIPLFFMWASSKPTLPDGLLVFHGFWIAPSLIYNHGVADTWQFIGISIIETLSPYLMARMLIRGPEGFVFFLKVLCLTLLAILPFVIYESVTYRRILSEILGIAQGGTSREETRWGLLRAQGPFDHPILLGVFSGSAFAMFYYAFGARFSERMGQAAAVVSGAVDFFSLSMGGWMTAMFQIMLMAYDKFVTSLRNRWHVLLYTTLALYLFVDIASNRGPALIFIQSFSFNEGAAATRLLTWRFGSDVVLLNPLFGVGLEEDWGPRPGWLTASVDNFWLLTAMRYGLVGVIPMVAAFIVVAVRLSRLEISDPVVAACRKGFLISLIGVCLSIGTVHIWNATYCYVMFLLGSTSWIFDHPSAVDPKARKPRAAAAGSGPGPDSGPGSSPDSGPGSGSGREPGPASRPGIKPGIKPGIRPGIKPAGKPAGKPDRGPVRPPKPVRGGAGR